MLVESRTTSTLPTLPFRPQLEYLLRFLSVVWDPWQAVNRRARVRRMAPAVAVPPLLPSPHLGRPCRRRLQLPLAPPPHFALAVGLRKELWERALAASTLAVVEARGRCEVLEVP